MWGNFTFAYTTIVWEYEDAKAKIKNTVREACVAFCGKMADGVLVEAPPCTWDRSDKNPSRPCNEPQGRDSGHKCEVGIDDA